MSYFQNAETLCQSNFLRDGTAAEQEIPHPLLSQVTEKDEGK